jgi:hypothetical protein
MLTNVYALLRFLYMEKQETADTLVRIYPSDHARLAAEARKRRTILAQIIHERLGYGADQ